MLDILSGSSSKCDLCTPALDLDVEVAAGTFNELKTGSALDPSISAQEHAFLDAVRQQVWQVPPFPCGFCGGRGLESIPCPSCNKQKAPAEQQQTKQSGGDLPRTLTCRSCGGKGWCSRPCPSCGKKFP